MFLHLQESVAPHFIDLVATEYIPDDDIAVAAISGDIRRRHFERFRVLPLIKR
jgi:hypothetical protein